MLRELIVLVISYIGVFLGLTLSKVAKEEVIAGKNNLVIFQNVLFVASCVWFAYSAPLSLLYKVMALVVVIAIVMTTDYKYASVGLLLGLSPEFIMSTLVFLYGFPQGSLMHKKSIKDVFEKTYPFLLFTVLGYILGKFLI